MITSAALKPFAFNGDRTPVAGNDMRLMAGVHLLASRLAAWPHRIFTGRRETGERYGELVACRPQWRQYRFLHRGDRPGKSSQEIQSLRAGAVFDADQDRKSAQDPRSGLR